MSPNRSETKVSVGLLGDRGTHNCMYSSTLDTQSTYTMSLHIRLWDDVWLTKPEMNIFCCLQYSVEIVACIVLFYLMKKNEFFLEWSDSISVYFFQYDEGWQLVKTVLDEAKGNVGTTTQFVLVKAKLLCVRYLSLPTSVFKASLEGLCLVLYYKFISARYLKKPPVKTSFSI